MKRVTWRWAGLWCVVLLGCAQQKDPNTTAYWVEALDDPKQRIQALKELGKRGDPQAAPFVIRWLAEEGEWQPDAAYVLGQLGDKSAIGPLRAQIDYTVGAGAKGQAHTRLRTTINIVRALGMLHATDATDNVIMLLSSPAPEIRVAAIEALGVLGDRKATDPLIVIASGETQPFLRKTAIQALGALGDAKAIETLVENLYVELPGVSFYRESRLALVQIGSAAIAPLRQTMALKNPKVAAIRMSDGLPIAEGAVEAKAAAVLGDLRAVIAEGDIAAQLEHWYSRFQQRESVPVYASVPGAVVELSYALGSLSGSAAAQRALLRVAHDMDARIRGAAVASLAMVGNAKAVDELLKIARTGDQQAREATIVAISRLGTGANLAAYDALATVSSPNVPVSVMAAMVKAERPRLEAAQACGVDAACWQSKLSDPAPRVRERAAYTLGRLGHKAGQPAGEPTLALLRAAQDPDRDVRMAAVSALGQLASANMGQLQDVYKTSQGKLEYAGVNDELERMIAWRKGHTQQ